MTPPIPDAAIQAAAEIRMRHYESEYAAAHLTWRDFADEAREALEAAAPVLAAHWRDTGTADVLREMDTDAALLAVVAELGISAPEWRMKVLRDLCAAVAAVARDDDRAKLAASIRELWGEPVGSAIAAAIEKGQI